MGLDDSRVSCFEVSCFDSQVTCEYKITIWIKWYDLQQLIKLNIIIIRL